MFDIHRWANWASDQAVPLREQGVNARSTLAQESEASGNPTLIVDLDTDTSVGRAIFWSTGDFDVSVQRNLSDAPTRIADLPAVATDQNFEAIFKRVVETVSG